MTNISLALPCLDQFSQLYEKTVPIRIGGTTQDRATYDPNLDAYVSYHVDDPLDAPMTLTYGPSYFDLIRMQQTYQSKSRIFQLLMSL